MGGTFLEAPRACALVAARGGRLLQRLALLDTQAALCTACAPKISCAQQLVLLRACSLEMLGTAANRSGRQRHNQLWQPGRGTSKSAKLVREGQCQVNEETHSCLYQTGWSFSLVSELPIRYRFDDLTPKFPIQTSGPVYEAWGGFRVDSGWIRVDSGPGKRIQPQRTLLGGHIPWEIAHPAPWPAGRKCP